MSTALIHNPKNVTNIRNPQRFIMLNSIHGFWGG